MRQQMSRCFASSAIVRSPPACCSACCPRFVSRRRDSERRRLRAVAARQPALRAAAPERARRARDGDGGTPRCLPAPARCEDIILRATIRIRATPLARARNCSCRSSASRSCRRARGSRRRERRLPGVPRRAGGGVSRRICRSAARHRRPGLSHPGAEHPVEEHDLFLSGFNLPKRYFC